MAKKKAHHRRRRSVSAPKRTKRKRRMGSPMYASTGAPRKRKHHAAGHKKRSRIGSGGGSRGQSAIMEYITTTLGVGVGLAVGELGGAFMKGTIPDLGLTAIKVVGGASTFAVGRNLMQNNGLVKGIGIGLTGAGINDGLKVLRTMIPGMAGPEKDMYIVLDNGMGAEKSVIGFNRQLYPAGGMGATKSVIGMQNSRLYGQDVHQMFGM